MLAIMKNRTGLSALAAVGVLLLAGCSTPAPEPSPTPTVSAEEQFLDEMRATEALFGFPDEQLVSIGESICDALRDGSTFDDMVRTLAITDYSEDEASAMIFASSKAYCPEQER